MRGIHFSLRWLFGVVSFLAVGCGLLIYASPFLSKLTFTAAVTGLLVGLFSAVYRIGDQRAFWAGFATFGFAYVWMVCGAWQSPDGSTPLRDRLVTTDLLTRCYELLPSSQPRGSKRLFILGRRQVAPELTGGVGEFTSGKPARLGTITPCSGTNSR